MGLTKAGVADGLLRKIDGYMERRKSPLSQVKATSEPKYAETVAMRWCQWWDTDGWKTPQKPWDPRIDGAAAEAAEAGGGPPDGK
jgi:hypothetical protein